MNRPTTVQVVLCTLVAAAGLVLLLLDVLPIFGLLLLLGGPLLLSSKKALTAPLKPWQIVMPLAAMAVFVFAMAYADQWVEAVPKSTPATRAVAKALLVVVFAGMVGNAWWHWWRARQQEDSQGK
jgi:hypothetical protein